MQADKGNFAAFSKVRGLLTSASEELPDVPLYYNLHTMCKTLRVTPPGNSVVRSAIVNAGERPCISAGTCLCGIDSRAPEVGNAAESVATCHAKLFSSVDVLPQLLLPFGN